MSHVLKTLLLLSISNAHATQINADLWADNWFALYQNSILIKEDTTPFKTKRSFIIKDNYENDTGLEYIGKRRQQMGDGGFIGQLFNAKTNELIDVSDDSWRCLVITKLR